MSVLTSTLSRKKIMCRFPKAVKKEERTVHGCSYYFDIKNFPVQDIHVKHYLLLLFYKSSSSLNTSSHPFPSYLLYAAPIQLSQPSSCSASNFVLILPPFQIIDIVWTGMQFKKKMKTLGTCGLKYDITGYEFFETCSLKHNVF